MILFKDSSVKMAGLKPEMDTVLVIANKHYNNYKLDTVITAGTEEFDSQGFRIHSVGSYHPRGYALDLRSRTIPAKLKNLFIQEFKQYLKSAHPAYQLINHASHFHIEYDLKIEWKLNHKKL